jgi:hypothetical protein
VSASCTAYNAAAFCAIGCRTARRSERKGTLYSYRPAAVSQS